MSTQEKLPNWNGWEKLLCPYFNKICLNVLGNAFLQHEYSWKKATGDGIVFLNANVFLKISYILEIVPHPPTLEIGIVSDNNLLDLNCFAIPLWHIIQENTTDLNYTDWTFNSESELTLAMNKIKNQLLEIYIMPLLNDEANLIALINEYSRK